MFRFIDWVLVLPEVLKNQLWAEMQQFEEDKRMRYVSSFERIFTQRGMEKGMEKGMEQGKAKLVELLLRQRFGALPEWAETPIAASGSREVGSLGGAGVECGHSGRGVRAGRRALNVRGHEV